jgi:hypothetical protein
MLGLAALLRIAQRRDAVRESHLRVVPVDQQQIHPRKFQPFQAFRDGAFEITWRQFVPIDLGGDEHLLSLEAALCETLM